MSGPPTSDLVPAFGGFVLAGHLLGSAFVLAVRAIGVRTGWWAPVVGTLGPAPVSSLVFESVGALPAAVVGALVAAGLVAASIRMWPPVEGPSTVGDGGPVD